VGPRAGLDAVTRILPCRESNTGRPARSLVTILTGSALSDVQNLFLENAIRVTSALAG
jgi:hypothetical protein